MNAAKTFLTTVPDDGSEHDSHGYPDECYSLTTFADSLVALAYEGAWVLQPPMVGLRNALIVDFVSETEGEAGASLRNGWNGPWELPMGSAATVYRRSETNLQNAFIERQMLFIGTAMLVGDFHREVIEKLLDVHSCREKDCAICAGRFSRGLAEAFQILADGTDQAAVHLFSKWQPSDEFRARLRGDAIDIRWHGLSEIPALDLDANRAYSIWDGTPKQADDFLATFWGPPRMNLSPAFTRALTDAEYYHHDQKRKTTTIPYVSHLLGVCSLVLEAGGDESEAIAALLHDAPEDAGGHPVLAAIEVNYGKDVARIVAGCTDAFVAKGKAKPAWRSRKKAYLAHLETAEKSTLLVSAADKLHNLRAIQSDFMQIGIAVFDRFNTGSTDKPGDVLWYYRSLYEVYVREDVAGDPRRSRLSAPMAGILLWLEEAVQTQTGRRA